MNWGEAALWGFSATLVLTTLLTSSRALGLTRMDMPFLLGTMITGNRDRARWVGFLIHVVNGWAFALLYIAVFHSVGWNDGWFGAALGLVHAFFMLSVGMLLMPSIHPRMASEISGPNPTRQLEPPGFMARNYGTRTPLANIVAHIIYGAILGHFYHP
jgi:hypothetical protein